MTTALLPAMVIAAYVSLALELTALHVPSVASTRSIWARERPARAFLLALPLVAVYAVYVLPLVAIVWPRVALGPRLFAPSAATDTLAAVLVVGGRVLALGSVLAIRRTGGAAAEPRALCTDGPFRFSRNPGLVGMYLFVLGLWVAAPSLPMLAGIAVYVAHMHLKVRMEEDWLERRFGPSWLAYRERTSRYWP